MNPGGTIKRKPLVDLKTEGSVKKLMNPEGGSGVIDFWAPWCAPCRATAPHFEAVANQYADQPVQFFKVNTESHPQLGAAFGVRALPTMLFVHNGEVLDAVVGMMDKGRLAEKVEWLMSKARGETFWDRLVGHKRPAQGQAPTTGT